MWDAPWWSAMAIKRRQPWLKEQPPWWALAVFGVMLAGAAVMIGWGIFFAEVPS